MAVRTAYDPTAGEVLTATNLERLAGGWIGYAEVIANQGSITTEVDVTGLSLAVTVGTGRRIQITLVLRASSSVVGDAIHAKIMEGGTALQLGESTTSQIGRADTIVTSVVLTPSSGAHTYKATILRGTGSGTITMTAGATFPAYLLVEDLGPAS